MSKKLTTFISTLLISLSIFSQNIDTLSLYNKSLDILHLYKLEQSSELLKIYRSSEGPKFIKIDRIERDIKNYNTKNLDTTYFNLDSIKVEVTRDTIPSKNNTKESYSQVVFFKFKFPRVNSENGNEYFYYIIAYSKWWEKGKIEPLDYNLYFLNFENN